MDRNDPTRVSRDPSAPGARESLRNALIDARRRLSDDDRRAASAALAERLDLLLGDVAGACLALYWPIRREPSLEPWPARWAARGARIALPVVEARHAPLAFVEWRPGEVLVEGPFRIPRPPRDDRVRPTVLVIPCVGFDARGYRLGYGGGYYDRTLAALAADGGPPPRAIGVAWDEAALEPFDPLPTDVPLEAIVTPTRTVRPGG